MKIPGLLREYRLLSVHVAGYHFNPGLLSTLLTIIMLYILVSLGFWQLDRAHFKDTLQQNIEQRKSLAAVSLDTLSGPRDERRYHSVHVKGSYDPSHSFLLDNRTFEGRVGYHVLTPLITDDGRAILINRGFIDQGHRRDEYPDLSVTDAEVTISGLLDIEPPRGLVLTEYQHVADHWPVVLQHLDIEELSGMLGYQLYDMVLWLDKDKIGSFTYDLPVLNLNSAKNNGYAFQWFAMAVALIIIYIAVNTRRTSERLATK